MKGNQTLSKTDVTRKDEGLSGLGRALRKHEAEILANSLQLFHRLPEDPYKFLLLKTPEGQRRMAHWTNLAIGAFLGDVEPFRQDMSEIGYLRAKQGFAFTDVIKVQQFYVQSVMLILQKHPESYAHDHKLLLLGLKRLINIAYDTVNWMTISFLSTREEIIEDKISKLHHIYLFTQKIMNTFSQEQILKLTRNEITAIYGVEKCHLTLCHPELVRAQGRKCMENLPAQLRELAEQVWLEDCEIYLDARGHRTSDVAAFEEKLAVAVPIRGIEKRYGSAIITSGGETFPFGEEERNLLFQFLSITAMMLENSSMVRQLERHNSRLSMLTMHTLEVSELERKKLSEDIHDTLTQTLTGINYKLQYCQEIAETNPDLLRKELSHLEGTVQDAIKQSRDIISSLHPDIIDNIGLTVALENLFNTFSRKTGTLVDFTWPDDAEFPSNITRGLYRVAIEALTNVKKHSNASRVRVSLRWQEENLLMTIEDNGRVPLQDPSELISPERGKFGLFYMQQRVESLNGSLQIELRTTGGLKLTAIVPVEHN